ncbi:hypothetical protein L7F22_014399 [Adiantum nelumboides]|nr:hypothetical protein [Adiantum nelumboides]
MAPLVIKQPREKAGIRPCPRLDIDRMREAAQRLLGDHDFRNMCKIDASKQINQFQTEDRWCFDRPCSPRLACDRSSFFGTKGEGEARGAGAEAAPDPTREDMYVLNLRGTAFLYHQAVRVRSQTAKWQQRTGPRLISGEQTDEEGDAGEEETDDEELQRLSNLAIYDRKPQYEMASDRPLVLWDCGFRPGDIQWRAGMYDGPLSNLDAPSKAVDLTSPLSMATASLHTLWSSMRSRLK